MKDEKGISIYDKHGIASIDNLMYPSDEEFEKILQEKKASYESRFELDETDEFEDDDEEIMLCDDDDFEDEVLGINDAKDLII